MCLLNISTASFHLFLGLSSSSFRPPFPNVLGNSLSLQTFLTDVPTISIVMILFSSTLELVPPCLICPILNASLYVLFAAALRGRTSAAWILPLLLLVQVQLSVLYIKQKLEQVVVIQFRFNYQ